MDTDQSDVDVGLGKSLIIILCVAGPLLVVTGVSAYTDIPLSLKVQIDGGM